MAYFRNNNGDFVDETGGVVADPAIRLQIGQSVGGDINKLPIYTSPTDARAASLSTIKTDLNAFQNDAFNQSADSSSKRASSTLEDQINNDNSAYDTAFKEYSDLKTKLGTLTAPNYQQTYNDLRTSRGVPGLESDLAATDTARNNLPYTERAVEGNAGLTTESQLGANVNQKDIPLGIQQKNLIDRLSLANDFIQNSLKFKQMDTEQAHQSLSDAIDLTAKTLDMTRQHVQDLLTQKQKEQDQSAKALDFNIKNNINTPAFLVGNQAYDAKTLTPISLEQYQKLTGQQVGLSEKDTSFAPNILTSIKAGGGDEKKLVLDMAGEFPDAGISPTDSLVVASSKLHGSKIYQDKVRGPVPPGNTVKLTEVTNDTDNFFQNGGTINGKVIPGKGKNDGFVSPEAWKIARDAWIQDGFSVDTFYSNFKKYINTADPQDY